MQNLCMFCEMSARVLCVETGLEVDGRDIDPIIPDIINSHLKGFGYSKKDLLTKKKYLYHQLKLIRYMQEDDDLSKEQEEGNDNGANATGETKTSTTKKSKKDKKTGKEKKLTRKQKKQLELDASMEQFDKTIQGK